MRWTLVLITLLFATGCDEETTESPPIQLPPAYGRGDEVAVQQSEVIGIVIDVSPAEDYAWNYKVMFKDRDILYLEKDLRMIERFDWSRKPAKKIQAEIDR